MNTKFLAVALAAVAGAAFADSTSVTTDYVLGVLPVSMSAGQAHIILNIPWIEPGTNDLVTSGVAVTNLVKTAGLSNGDTLRWYDGSGYKGWVVENGQWKAAQIVGANSVVEALASNTPELMRGQSLILTRNNAVSATTIYVVGQNANSSGVTSTLTKDQYTLIAPPAVTASEAGYLIEKLSGVAANNDVITFVLADGKSVSYYYYDGKWWHDYIDDEEDFQHVEVTTIALPVGTGIYYLRRGDTTSINW